LRTPEGTRISLDKEMPTKLLLLDEEAVRNLIRSRQEQEIDQSDEVWEGVYIVPPLATNPHQDLALALAAILFNIIVAERRGRVQAGANVSNRRTGWKRNFRCPDVVVVLNDSTAIDCGTHWLNGPDFLIEVESPDDASHEKIPFYSQIRVRELLIVHRDSRQLQLYRHDGRELQPVPPSDLQGGNWLVSAVVPLAFRRKVVRRNPRTEVVRTDATPGNWTV
jgi:Uma2 family endonuclease